MNDLTNFITDSKQLYDIVVEKYPTATRLTDEDKQLISDYNGKYGFFYKDLPNSHEEYLNQKIYWNIYSLTDNYLKYSQLKFVEAELSVIHAYESSVTRILHEQKFE